MTAKDYTQLARHIQLASASERTGRPELPRTDGERATLTAFLDWHRETFALKCAGVAADRMSEKAVPPSGLSLHGLVRHLAGVERWWFRQHFAGEDLPTLHYSDDAPDQDFEWLDGDVAEALALWRGECEHARRIVAAAPSLDATCRSLVTGEEMSLRFILVDLIAEYARHNGHADLLRERIDGATGF
ncbi:DinB family protein [Streptomyces sp. NBC_00448]|uniref:DinB family protein n=1 Tax=Streptomyces sp. NBC_00448 TaxID=2903652 RepID=UPI002E1E3F73